MKGGEEFPKIVGISGKQPLVAQGKRSDENIGNRASGRLMVATFLNLSRPCLTSVRGICRHPAFLVINPKLEKKFFQRFDVPGERRSQLDKRHRTYQEPLGKFGIQEALGAGCMRRVVKTDIKQDACIDDPCHYSRSPSRSNSIQPAVVVGMPFWNRFMDPRME
jgi:hypothetical protein